MVLLIFPNKVFDGFMIHSLYVVVYSAIDFVSVLMLQTFFVVKRYYLMIINSVWHMVTEISMYPWYRNPCFNPCFNREIYEFVGSFILRNVCDVLQRKNVGLYHDDGL